LFFIASLLQLVLSLPKDRTLVLYKKIIFKELESLVIKNVLYFLFDYFLFSKITFAFILSIRIFNKKFVSKIEVLLRKEQSVEVCDATKDAIRFAAGLIKNSSLYKNFL